MQAAVPEDLIRILRCPKCRQPVVSAGDRLVCSGPACGLRYPVREGIPVMLVEEADPPAPRVPENPSRP